MGVAVGRGGFMGVGVEESDRGGWESGARAKLRAGGATESAPCGAWGLSDTRRPAGGADGRTLGEGTDGRILGEGADGRTLGEGTDGRTLGDAETLRGFVRSDGLALEGGGRSVESVSRAFSVAGPRRESCEEGLRSTTASGPK